MKLPAIASTVAVSGVIHATVLIAWAAFSTHPRPEPALTFSTTIEAVLVDAALDAGQTPEPSTPASDAAATAALAANNKQLHAEVATLLTTRETLESTVTELESDKATLLETRETLEGTITELEQDKSALLADKASLGEQLATVTGERQQLSADKATLLETRETLEGEAEQLATTQAQQQQQLLELESVRVGLSDDLSRLQGTLAALQLEKTALVTRSQSQAETLASLSQSEQAAAQERDALALQVTSMGVASKALRTELVALRNEMESLIRFSVHSERALEESKALGEELSEQLVATALDYKLTKEELTFLRTEYAEKVAAFQKERKLLVTEHRQELDILREKQTDLEARYNRLIRPARSTVGRHVVEVKFWKELGEYRYSLREPGEFSARNVDADELHSILGERKAQHGDKLYTRIRFPNGSEISHNEAWRFTNDIHNRYDYYYQD
jgi:chromosome segregation ATPase